jgi:hypothetical protein
MYPVEHQWAATKWPLLPWEMLRMIAVRSTTWPVSGIFSEKEMPGKRVFTVP